MRWVAGSTLNESVPALYGGGHRAPLWSLSAWRGGVVLPTLGKLGSHRSSIEMASVWCSSPANTSDPANDGTAPLQWAESLFRELDYRREARNGIRFRELYGDLEVGDFSFGYLTMVVWTQPWPQARPTASYEFAWADHL